MASRTRAALTNKRRDVLVGIIDINTAVLGSRKQERLASRNDDGVLVVSGEAAVGGPVGPTVFVQGNFS
jgi:hypothetical protein